MKMYGGVKVKLHVSISSAMYGSGYLHVLILGKKPRVTTGQEAWQTQQSGWTM
jgi:hypothetical protein